MDRLWNSRCAHCVCVLCSVSVCVCPAPARALALSRPPCCKWPCPTPPVTNPPPSGERPPSLAPVSLTRPQPLTRLDPLLPNRAGWQSARSMSAILRRRAAKDSRTLKRPGRGRAQSWSCRARGESDSPPLLQPWELPSFARIYAGTPRNPVPGAIPRAHMTMTCLESDSWQALSRWRACVGWQFKSAVPWMRCVKWWPHRHMRPREPNTSCSRAQVHVRVCVCA